MTLPPVSSDNNGAVVGIGVGDRREEGSDGCVVPGQTLGIKVFIREGSAEGASVVGGTVTLTSPVGDVTVVTFKKHPEKSRSFEAICISLNG